MKRKLTLFILLLFVGIYFYSPFQFGTFPYLNGESVEEPWDSSIQHVKISSSLDNNLQDAYFRSSTNVAPLIISLHQWSANYTHFDPMSELAIEKNWNYIRPNFRGPNNNPIAGGSEYVINDIDDAVKFALSQGNVDDSHIYIIGASGGGHAALMHLLNSELEISKYSVWVPVTDLIAWYGESRIRDTGYDEDILAITKSEDGPLNIYEAKKRSPMYQTVLKEKIKDIDINIFAGVNDGYDGTVPISHSINFYNKLVEDMDYGEENRVPYDIEAQLLYTQTLYEVADREAYTLGTRDIIYQTDIENISLVIFDGVSRAT